MDPKFEIVDPLKSDRGEVVPGRESYAEFQKKLLKSISVKMGVPYQILKRKDFKMGEKKGFNVAGVTFENVSGWERGGEPLKRLEIIQKYVGHGTKFRAFRDFKNEYDKNAIRIDVVFKSGRAVDIGYVPQGKGRLADQLAPLIDAGSKMHVTFGRKHVNEKTGETWGIWLRYQILTPEDFAETMPPRVQEVNR